MIGIFDSGVGGLSVLIQIRQRLPHHDLIYLADQINLPYGPRPLAEIRSFSEGITRYMLDQGATIIVIACNTASAAALHHLRAHFPNTTFVGLEPAVRPAARDTHSKNIGVLATAATFTGQMYVQLVEKYADGISVHARACPELVTLAERGAPWTADDYNEVGDMLRPMREASVDQLVLGCTHFTFVEPLIRDAIGENVTIIDPAPAVAKQTERKLEDINAQIGQGEIRYYTTGDLSAFQTQTQRLTGLDAANATRLIWQNGTLR